MEQITECLVKKEPDKIDVLKKTGIVIAAFICALLSMMLFIIIRHFLMERSG